ncbi:MAG: hypothetical protein R3321_01305 [Nitrososphaeraceae archaeon]|nr:hypothetical protein [Nitrososphaeraceae archaeon]
MKVINKKILENVKGFRGEEYDIYVMRNVYGIPIFVPEIVKGKKRYLGVHLGFRNFFKKYPSLEKRQAEIVEKVRAEIPGIRLL